MKAALIQIPKKIEELIDSNLTDLEEAWSICGDEPLTISFSVKIGFDKKLNQKPICEITISFVKEKIKESKVFNWDDKQLSLLGKETK